MWWVDGTVGLAQRGDPEAFRVLYRDIQPRLLRYLHALVGQDAEDVAAETWLQITRDLPAFSGDYDHFRGWTATIARHRALDHLRRAARRPPPPCPPTRPKPSCSAPSSAWTPRPPARSWANAPEPSAPPPTAACAPSPGTRHSQVIRVLAELPVGDAALDLVALGPRHPAAGR
jgi:DNA-directed RNA polymerase specialized sigma24 family protein